MRLRLDALVFAALAAIASAGTVRGQCPGGAAPAPAACPPGNERCLERLAEDALTVNRWPMPYVCPDRVAAVSPFATMVANGWRRQNFLLESHFRENGRELTEAGQRLVYWVLTQAPPQYRTIQVAETSNAQETAARLASVQKYVATLVPAGQSPPIVAAISPPDGMPAYWPDPENTMLGRSIPVQRPVKIYVPDRFSDKRYKEAY